MPMQKREKTTLAVEVISHLPIDLESKIELVAILIGEKPATILHAMIDESETRKALLQEFLNDIAKAGLLLELGQKEFFDPSGYIQDGQYHTDGRGYHRVPVFIAKTRRNLKAIATASTDEEFGKLYGFPETAVMAYVGKGNYTRFSMPWSMKIAGPDHYTFLGFVLSMENWHEETDQVRKVFEAIKKAAPGLVEKWVRCLRGNEHMDDEGRPIFPLIHLDD